MWEALNLPVEQLEHLSGVGVRRQGHGQLVPDAASPLSRG